MSNNNKPLDSTDNISLQLALGWGVGTLGISVMFNTLNVLMQRFATDYLGIMAATWSFIYLGSKLYDAVTDPLMGWLSDRSSSRWGRRRPWLLLGGVISAAVFFLLFNSASVEESSSAVLMLFVLMLLYSTGYTVFNVPYMAMPAEMTDDYRQRAYLVSFRVYAIALGTVAGISLAPFLVSYFGGGRDGYQAMAAVYGLVILLSTAACFYFTGSARQTVPDRAAEHLSVAEKWRALRSNKPFLLLIAVKFLQLAGLALSQAVLIYFMVYILGRGYGFLGLYGLVASLFMLSGPPLCLWALRFFNKSQVFIGAALLYSLLLASWWFSGPEEAVAVILIRAALLGVASGGMLMMGQAMLPDTISYDYQQSGMRREGLFAGLYTTAEKLAFATGGAVSGFVLAAFGYVSSTQGGAEQPASAITAIYLNMSLLPALLTLLSCLLLKFYRLDEMLLHSSKPTSETVVQ